MATGDAALAAGMDTVDPAIDLVRDGADEINKTRDYLANRTSAVLTVAKGGTGATNAVGALANLGIYIQATDPGHAEGRIWIKVPA